MSAGEVARDRPQAAEVVVGILIAAGLIALAFVYGVVVTRRKTGRHPNC